MIKWLIFKPKRQKNIIFAPSTRKDFTIYGEKGIGDRCKRFHR